MKNFLLMMMFWGWLVPLANAQSQVSGTVTDYTDNQPLPGVNVLIKGTPNGTVTDIQGKYTITTTEENAVLVFSFIGYETVEQQVNNRAVIDVNMMADITQLSEVVVTALGIEREAKEVTYSTQTIAGEELTTVKDQNMINTLAGKTAGINIIKSSGGVGGSSRVLLRGNKSINGANQPLYVIDGLPMSNANLEASDGNLFGNSVDNGSPIANLNPEDIESISVLKGASASALYGSQAANGVILITTKKGKKGVSEISFSSSLQFESALMLPDLQDKYGKSNPSPSTIDTWGDTSTGASKSHVKDFFNTGSNFINSISLSNGNELGQYRISYARTDASGIIPENEMYKNNFSLRGTTKLFNKVDIDGSATLVNQKIANTPFPGFYHNPVLSTYLFPDTRKDWDNYRENYQVLDPARNLMVQNYPYKDENFLFVNENPYWIVNREQNDSWRNRNLYNLKATVPILKNLNAIGRISYDRTEDKFEHRLSASSSTIVVNVGGDYQTRRQAASQLYSDLLLDYKTLFSDAATLSATIGFSNTYNTVETSNFQSTTDNAVGLIVPNYFAVQNFESGFIKEEDANETLSQAFFGTATVGFKETVFLDVTLRNEWSSTLPPKNNSFFYPSAGLTLILSEMIGTSDNFTFAKLRGSFSKVGNALPFGPAFPQPSTINSQGLISPPTTAPLGELKPESVTSFEIGTNLRLFKNSIELDLTYYDTKTEDQFFTIPGAIGDAYQNYFINGGTVRNNGVEAILAYHVLSSGDFRYTTSFNFAKNNNEVLEIDPRLEGERFIVTSLADARMYEIRVQKGGAYGDFYGQDVLRDANGNVVVNTGSDGEKSIARTPSSELVYLGNPNPDWQLGWQNTFSYKNLSMKFLIDGKFGGEVISQTEALLDAFGRSQRTADARNNGSVKIGDESFDPEFWYTGVGGKELNGIGGQYVYDATNIRLREFALSYTLPPDVLKGFAKRVTISAIGRNLFFLKNNAPFDPEVSSSNSANNQGIGVFSVPSTRTYGASLNVTF